MLEELNNLAPLVVFTKNSENQVIRKPLRESIKQSLKNYFLELNDKNVNNLYHVALSELEIPLLDIVMQYTRGNQTRAACIMGINRGTLRKKLKKYYMD